MHWTPADLGDIVHCRFPEQVGIPGPKERPALVLQIEEDPACPKAVIVVVAYATSRKTDVLHAGEFVITASANSGLTRDTKFDLANHRRLPFNDIWFGPAPGRTPAHPRRGRLDLSDSSVKRKLQAALVEAKRHRR